MGFQKTAAFLAGGGEMGERIRAYPWAEHPLGPPENWPQALRTSIRLMLNTGHPMAMFWGPELFFFYNDAYSHSIGPERHPGSLGQRGSETWGEIWDIIGPQIDQVMSGGGATWSVNALVPITRHGKREEVYWTYSYGPIDDENSPNGVGGILVVCTETTAIVLAEHALRESEQRLRLATGAAEIGTWDFNPVSGDLRWDARCKELFGVSADATVTYEGTFLAGLHPDDRERTHASVTAALEKGEPYDIEYRVIGLEDGVERWIVATGKAIFENGRAVRFIGTVLDISRRKLAERRLEIVNRTAASVAAELDHDKIVQTITDAGVELTGAQFGAFFYNVVNSAGESYMLYALSGVPREAFSKFPMPRNTAVFAPTFGGEGPVRADDILKDPRYGHSAPHKGMPEGHLPVRSYLAVPVISRSGEVHGGLFFGHEEVGVFKAEHETLLLGIAGHAATAIDNARLVQQLQFLNATLEHRVTEEVGERMKAEELLRQAQKLEAIGQLTGGVAHDFNNLLMVVSGGLNLLERSSDAERRQSLVDRMREAVTRGATLTQQLLAFSRKQELKPEVIDFKDHLLGMGDLLDRSLGPNVSVEADTPHDLWPIFADQTALQLAVLNLAVNARDAMPNGGKIVIRGRNGAPDDVDAACVSVSVIDNGTGMSAETQARIFEPFFTTKEIGKGSGLGLAQVHGFAQQSGGYVEVQSAPDQGTTITMVLPKAASSAEAQPPRATTRPPSQSGKVLLVEDDAEVAAITAQMLEDLGWRVTHAASAEAALKTLAQTPIDIVFSDVMMPGGMSGLDLARELRAKRPHTPVVLASGYSAKVQREVNAQGLRLLPKPYTMDALAIALAEARARA